MKQDKTNQKLFLDFPPVSTEKWMEKITADLKGADFDHKLVWNSPEGIKIRPFYRSEDLEHLKHLNSLPNQFPYARGNKAKHNDWWIRQDIIVNDNPKVANQKAIDILNKGVTSLGFIFCDNYTFQAKDISILLANIELSAVEINFVNSGKQSLAILEAFIAYVNQQNVKAEAIHASFDYDPFSNMLLKGNFYADETTDFKEAAKLVEAAKVFPHLHVLSVNGAYLRNAAANTVEELACAIASGAEYLSQLTDMGYDAAEVASRIRFNFGVGPNYFMEIAKLRAARILWAQTVKAFGTPDEAAKMYAHSTNTIFNKCVYDAHANLLRTTTETMSAIVGGTDSFAVLPYNAVFEQLTDFSERIARNQQLLLKEESFLDKIVDPSAGSYYIENLTNAIMEKAWELFLQIDEKKGYLNAIHEGMIQNIIAEVAEQRQKAIATRKDIYLGTNQYPNFTEAMDKEIPAEVLKPIDLRNKEAICSTIKQFRATQSFEKLRNATDMYSKNNKRPLAFMLTIGNLAMRKARAQFSSNFFACAGFSVQDNNGFNTIEEGLKAAKEAKADIVVLCSSDDEYATLGNEFAEKNKDMIGVIAGYPKAIMEELTAKGLKFVHVKSNLLQELNDYQKALNIV